MVKLVYATPLVLAAQATRFSKANQGKSDSKNMILGPKDKSLLKRVAFNAGHESVLEHSFITFDVEMSQKALMEGNTHRICISKVVTSSRYALRKIEIKFEETGDEDINAKLRYWKSIIEHELRKGKSLDDVSMMLPQAFIYSLRLSFNMRSLLNFLRLRLTKEAHKTIRKVAIEIINELPHEWFEMIMNDENIRRNYELFNG